jgi:monoterpene epsilon-lactone hydrolase
MARRALEGFAAVIRENVRARPEGEIDVAAGRAAFEMMGRTPQIVGGAHFERGAVPDDGKGRAPLFERILPDLNERRREILYLHGGAFALGSLEGYRAMVSHVATACRATTSVLEYRLAPEHPFPAAPDDAFAAWKAMAKDGVPRVIVGDSAGGNLALSTMIRARDEGLPLPAAAVLLSPWLDLDHAGASMKTNAERDPLIRVGDSRAYAKLYLGGVSPRDPRVSPLYADLRGLPPLYVQVGKDECLYDDSIRLAERARAAGVEVTLDAFDGVFHVWHFFAGIAPEADDAIERIGRFVRGAASSRPPA